MYYFTHFLFNIISTMQYSQDAYYIQHLNIRIAKSKIKVLVEHLKYHTENLGLKFNNT